MQISHPILNSFRHLCKICDQIHNHVILDANMQKLFPLHIRTGTTVVAILANVRYLATPLATNSVPKYLIITPHLSGKQVNFCAKRSCYTPFLRALRANFSHVLVEMIERPKLEGSQSQGTLGQALLPVSAVTKGSNPLSLLPKQAEGFGPECPKTGCPLISAFLSFHELHGCIQLEKLIKIVYNMTFSHKN